MNLNKIRNGVRRFNSSDKEFIDSLTFQFASYYLNDSDEESLFCSIFKWALYNSIDLVWANSNNKELIKKIEKVFAKPLQCPDLLTLKRR